MKWKEIKVQIIKKNVNRSKIECSPSNYFIKGWGFKEKESTTD